SAVARSSSGICLQRARQGEVLQKWRNFGQFRRYWCGSQTVGGAPDENCFTMSRTGGGGVKSAPCLKSKRRFRLKCVRTRSDHETTSGPSGTQRGSSTARHYVGGLARRRRLQPPQDFRHCT